MEISGHQMRCDLYQGSPVNDFSLFKRGYVFFLITSVTLAHDDMR